MHIWQVVLGGITLALCLSGRAAKHNTAGNIDNNVKWNQTTLGCKSSNECGERMWCQNGSCECPNGYLKANNTCNDVVGLPCTSLGQCEQYVPHSICDLTTTHRCICKSGYGYRKNASVIPAPDGHTLIQISYCSAILGEDCLGHEQYCKGVQNAECGVPRATQITRANDRIFTQICQCVNGLRPESSSWRQVMVTLSAPLSQTEATFIPTASAACEDVIGNSCSSNLTDCSAFVENSYCNLTSAQCACDLSFVLDPITRLCSSNTSLNRSVQRDLQPDQRGVKLQYNIDSQCFMIYYPCNVPNSICAPHPYIPYQGYCTCAPGFVQQDYRTCVPETIDMPDQPDMPGPPQTEEVPPFVTTDSPTTPELPIPETTTLPSSPTTTLWYTVLNTTTTTVTTTAGPSVLTTTAVGVDVTTGTPVNETTAAVAETTTVSEDEDNTTAMTSELDTTRAEEPTDNETTTVESVQLPLTCGLPGNSKSDVFDLGSQFAKTSREVNLNKTRVEHVVHNKIVGGQAAQENEICWQAGVLSFMEDYKSYEYCGGSILNPNYVLTAMHCVVTNDTATLLTPVERMFVSVGALDFPTAAPDSGYCGKHIKVRRVIVHPDAEFVMSGTDFKGIANDLALIELDETLDFTQNCVCAICLLDERPVAGEECVISGYGCQDASCLAPPPHNLAWLKVPIVAKDSDQCQHDDPKLSTNNIVCIGSTEDKDACQGDSGGPLVCYDTKRSRYYLYGATSYGYGGLGRSCAAGQLARYTDIFSYLPWIRANCQDTPTA